MAQSAQDTARKFTGKYRLVKKENVLQFYKSSGMPESLAVRSERAWPKTLEIDVTGKTVSFHTPMPPMPVYWSRYILDEEVTEITPGFNIVSKSKVRVEGDKLLVDMKNNIVQKSCFGLFRDEARVYQFSGDVLTVTHSSSGTGVVIKCLYKPV